MGIPDRPIMAPRIRVVSMPTNLYRVGFLLCMASALTAVAQQSRVNQESLLIGRGDLLTIHIVDTPELEQHPRVEDSGKIPLTGAGQLEVAGLTPAEAAVKIQERLITAHYLNHPQVSVTIEQYATQYVSVIGQVKVPGAYPVATPRPIIDVIALAGGITELADRDITVEKHGEPNEQISYNLSNSPQDAIAHQVLVGPGDTIMVAKAGIVYILGDVSRPGGFVMQNNSSHLTVLQAIAEAGGTAHSAVPSHTTLTRRLPNGQYDQIPLQLSKMQQGKIPDMQLSAGDIIYVPFSYLRNMVVGGSGIVAAATSAAIYTH
jgi:polysaccharide export outer membrane protein